MPRGSTPISLGPPPPAKPAAANVLFMVLKSEYKPNTVVPRLDYSFKFVYTAVKFPHFQNLSRGVISE